MAESTARTEAKRDLRETLATCTNPETGCFRDKPNSLISMLYFDDSGVRAELNNIAIGADKAAKVGTPLDEATYMPTRLQVTGAIGEIVQDGPPKPIPHDDSDVPPNSVSMLQVEVANCAFVCGQAVELCPLRTE